MKKILIVEDEPNLRDGIATAFQDRGWRVLGTQDPQYEQLFQFYS